ncbi:hypothetical protein PHMEG_0002410 [Phytophthora megakarya]|uniref:Uncharacterized protein n=1 Tax=Phytophthora megakarya TaxID=4795 RepID=A0A225X0R7_9STRA|nr:hypothetical protein PHMEG_0002410 [Phytophthora megakarya]
MLILVSRDGDNKHIVLAVGLGSSEAAVYCHWFMLNCKQAGTILPGTPVFIDRAKR